MTPQTHLTHHQLCDLLLDPPPQQNDTALDHLRDCYACAAELATLTTSLSGYRDTAHAVARHEFNTSPRVSPAPLLGHRSPLHPIYWAIAATALVIAILPFTATHRAPLVQPQPTHAVTTAYAGTESDAALLEDINQDLSASIPDPMQPLVDPTASSSTDNDSTAQRTN